MNDINPKCFDTRRCVFRDDESRCQILTSAYPGDMCRFRKEHITDINHKETDDEQR